MEGNARIEESQDRELTPLGEVYINLAWAALAWRRGLHDGLLQKVGDGVRLPIAFLDYPNSRLSGLLVMAMVEAFERAFRAPEIQWTQLGHIALVIGIPSDVYQSLRAELSEGD